MKGGYKGANHSVVKHLREGRHMAGVVALTCLLVALSVVPVLALSQLVKDMTAGEMRERAFVFKTPQVSTPAPTNQPTNQQLATWLGTRFSL